MNKKVEKARDFLREHHVEINVIMTIMMLIIGILGIF